MHDDSKQPVAWRYQTPTGWHATTDAQKAVSLRAHHPVEPLYAAPQASEAVRNADQDEMERLGWVNIGYKHDLEKARRAISFCNIPGFDTMSLDNAIYWLRSKADKGGGDCAKGAGDTYRDSEHFHKTASIAELGAWQRGWDDCRDFDDKQRSALAAQKHPRTDGGGRGS